MVVEDTDGSMHDLVHESLVAVVVREERHVQHTVEEWRSILVSCLLTLIS